MSKGTVGILNVGAGDVKLSFDKANPAEAIRAARIVKDMLRRGYALLVEVERKGKKAFERAKDFDEATGEYVVADFDPIQAQEADRKEEHGQSITDETIGAPLPGAPGGEVPDEAPKRGRPGKRGGRVAASSTRAVGVARSAGG